MAYGSTHRALWRIVVFVSYFLLALALPLTESKSQVQPSTLNIPEIDNLLDDGSNSLRDRHGNLLFRKANSENSLRKDRLLKLLFGVFGKQNYFQHGGGEEGYKRKRSKDNEHLHSNLENGLLSKMSSSYPRRRDIMTFPYEERDALLYETSYTPSKLEFGDSEFESLPTKRQQGWYVQYGKRNGVESSRTVNIYAEIRKLLQRQLAAINFDEAINNNSEFLDNIGFGEELGLNAPKIFESEDSANPMIHRKTLLSDARQGVTAALKKLLQSFDTVDSRPEDREQFRRFLNSAPFPEEVKDKSYLYRDSQTNMAADQLSTGSVGLYQNFMDKKSHSNNLDIPGDALLTPTKRQQGWYTQYGKRGAEKTRIKKDVTIQ